MDGVSPPACPKPVRRSTPRSNVASPRNSSIAEVLGRRRFVGQRPGGRLIRSRIPFRSLPKRIGSLVVFGLLMDVFSCPVSWFNPGPEGRCETLAPGRLLLFRRVTRSIQGEVDQMLKEALADGNGEVRRVAPAVHRS